MSGRYRHLATIEEVTQTKDAMGGPVRAWAEFAKSWCQISPVSGSEKWYAHEKHATATHVITMRYLRGIDTKMRITARGRTFEITDIQNVGELDKTTRIVVTEDADKDQAVAP